MSAEAAVDLTLDPSPCEAEGGCELSPTAPECLTRIRELQAEVGEQAVTIARLEERAAAAEEKANVAIQASDKWQANANEWRGALDDQRAQFVTRTELDLRVRTIWAVSVALVTLGMGGIALAFQLLK